MAEAGLVTPTTWGEREIKGPVHLFRERLLLRTFAQLVPTGQVLDAGCGSGSLAIELCRLGYEVEAVEQIVRLLLEPVVLAVVEMVRIHLVVRGVPEQMG